MAPVSRTKTRFAPPPGAEAAYGSKALERPKILSTLDLISIGDKLPATKIAEVGRLRDMLGPGTLPLLAALFGEAASDEKMPAVVDVRDALGLPGSQFRPETTLDLGRCVCLRGTLAVGDGRGSAVEFLGERQRRLDEAFGPGRLVAFLQRERYQPKELFSSVIPTGPFDDVGARREGSDPAAILVFLSADLPIKGASGMLRRLGIGGSAAVTAVTCNLVAIATDQLQQAGGAALLGDSIREATFSPVFGVALTRLDAAGVAPLGFGLMFALLAQDLGRQIAVALRGDVKLRGGLFLPSPSLGSLGRSWSFEGLAPTRLAELEVAAAGGVAGLAAALLLCIWGDLQGNDGLLLVEVQRLPFLLARHLNLQWPVDNTFTVVSLQSAALAKAADDMASVNPLLFAGGVALTAQAIQLLPLRGLDGGILARGILGPRPAQFLEVATAVLLTLGALGRLGPEANPAVCQTALLAWGLYFVDRAEGQLPPREDFDEENDETTTRVVAAALLAAAAAILVPGHLVPYGLITGIDGPLEL